MTGRRTRGGVRVDVTLWKGGTYQESKDISSCTRECGRQRAEGRQKQSIKMCTSENVTMELVMTYTNLFPPSPSPCQHRLGAKPIIQYQFILSASIGWAFIFLTTFSIPKPNYVQLYDICITFKSMCGEIQVRP